MPEGQKPLQSVALCVRQAPGTAMGAVALQAYCGLGLGRLGLSARAWADHRLCVGTPVMWSRSSLKRHLGPGAVG